MADRVERGAGGVGDRVDPGVVLTPLRRAAERTPDVSLAFCIYDPLRWHCRELFVMRTYGEITRPYDHGNAFQYWEEGYRVHDLGNGE